MILAGKDYNSSSLFSCNIVGSPLLIKLVYLSANVLCYAVQGSRVQCALWTMIGKVDYD